MDKRERETMKHFHRLLAFQDYRETGRARENQPDSYYEAFAEAYALGENSEYTSRILEQKECFNDEERTTR
jgi:hypothetical protein